MGCKCVPGERSKSGGQLSFKAVYVLGISLVLACSTAAQTARPSHRHSTHATPKDPPVQQPIEAPPPLSPEQMPASPPQIAFSNDTLTISANNATLGDILRAVHRQTGAAVDMPGNATDRVVGRFGPGPVRDVMTSLLNGSHFNYVLLGSQTNPNGLERIVLISRSSGMDQTAQLSNPTAAQNQAGMGVPQPAEAQEPADDAAETTMPEANEAADDQANQAQPSEEQPQPQPQNPFGQSNVKTPEQLLQELQQRQQQMQQQMQQQGNPQTPPPPPPQ
jgi:hypothetical protein